jgi:putative membrane protein
MTYTGHRRFPAQVYSKGEEPDPRFTLANERTFLAWIRTSLALIAAGVALEALNLPIEAGIRLAASLILIVAGLFTPAQAWFGWMATERSLRNSLPLPSSAMGAPLAAAASLVGILILLGVLLR